ncbi:hypothetical protein KIN20_020659 [Parelaphostrongylus tenuis]|uniref:Uncharacterized protein n=1 Tax=Parelaphostrongylus tenuis TaxID=148309 RepID=A0AAD5MT39_PARTN|nr:hypothetical protein KIN20_020659 [Parelaphostrongylus tenuis]
MEADGKGTVKVKKMKRGCSDTIQEDRALNAKGTHLLRRCEDLLLNVKVYL